MHLSSLLLAFTAVYTALSLSSPPTFNIANSLDSHPLDRRHTESPTASTASSRRPDDIFAFLRRGIDHVHTVHYQRYSSAQLYIIRYSSGPGLSYSASAFQLIYLYFRWRDQVLVYANEGGTGPHDNWEDDIVMFEYDNRYAHLLPLDVELYFNLRVTLADAFNHVHSSRFLTAQEKGSGWENVYVDRPRQQHRGLWAGEMVYKFEQDVISGTEMLEAFPFSGDRGTM